MSTFDFPTVWLHWVCSTGILKNGDAVPTHHADAVGIWGSASPSSVEIIRPGHGFRFVCSVWCRYPGFILSRSITVTDSNYCFYFVSSVSKPCELWTAAIDLYILNSHWSLIEGSHRQLFSDCGSSLCQPAVSGRGAKPYGALKTMKITGDLNSEQIGRSFS